VAASEDAATDPPGRTLRRLEWHHNNGHPPYAATQAMTIPLDAATTCLSWAGDGIHLRLATSSLTGGRYTVCGLLVAQERPRNLFRADPCAACVNAARDLGYIAGREVDGAYINLVRLHSRSV
jgi:hypothetical protein